MGNSSSSRKNNKKKGKETPVKSPPDEGPAESQKVQVEQAAKTSKDDSVVVEEASTVGSDTQPQQDTVGSDTQPQQDTVGSDTQPQQDTVGSDTQPQQDNIGSDTQPQQDTVGSDTQPQQDTVGSDTQPQQDTVGSDTQPQQDTVGSDTQPQQDTEQASKNNGVATTGDNTQPQAEKVKEEVSKRIKQRRFSEIEHTISTGDLALLYREGQEVPHYAVFVQHSECDPNFPLLLIKGKTKPLPLTKFKPVRHAHSISAVTRIFYGDYKQVAIRHLNYDKPIAREEAMALIDQVMEIPFTPHELEAIEKAKSPEERSSIVCTLMVSHLYHLLGVLRGDPTTVTPANLEDHLDLHDPVFLKLPRRKSGPVANDDDPPFLATLVKGIYPPPNVTTKMYSSVAETLDTGDIVLFSGADSSGSLIKFFDRSQFSHVGLVLKAKYASQLLIWDASTNHVGLVDIESGKVRRGVQLVPLYHKIFSGWYDRVAVRKLAGIPREKRIEMYEELLKFRKEIQGRPFEKDWVELLLSAIDIRQGFLSFLHNQREDLSSLFCSELVAAAYQRMGLLGRDKPSNAYSPDDFSSAHDLKLNVGYLEPEVYIEMKLDFDRQTSTY